MSNSQLNHIKSLQNNSKTKPETFSTHTPIFQQIPTSTPQTQIELQILSQRCPTPAAVQATNFWFQQLPEIDQTQGTQTATTSNIIEPRSSQPISSSQHTNLPAPSTTTSTPNRGNTTPLSPNPLKSPHL
ncbi:hypothetical protein Droror1_Dr00016159 [Drosera rotundifolia]